MKTHDLQSCRQSGFVVVAVLLVISVIAVMGTAYIRHVDAGRRDSTLSARALSGRAAFESGTEVARKAVLAGESLTGSMVASGTSEAEVETNSVTSSRTRMLVRAVGDDGIGATALAEMSWIPLEISNHPDALPRIDSVALQAAMLDTTIPKHRYGGQTTLTNVVLDGIVVVENTSALYMDNVVINGCLVSEDALLEDPFGDFDDTTVPCAVITGNLRIEPADFLPGLAVCMPDGVLMTTSADSRIQIGGDVVSHTLVLDRPGAITGNIATVQTPTLHSSFDRPGQGRRPGDWSPTLDTTSTATDVDFMAFVPRTVTIADLSAIINLQLPARHSEAGETSEVTETPTEP